MSSAYRSRQEVADKADYEGGVLDFVFGYGLSVDDLPEDDMELRDALAALLAMRPALDHFKDLLPEPGEDD